MNRILILTLVLISSFNVKPAKADFGLIASVAGLIIGTSLVVATPFLDNGEADQNEIEENGNFFSHNLNHFEMEALKNQIEIERMDHGFDSWEDEEIEQRSDKGI
jgi:hypothetical protein